MDFGYPNLHKVKLTNKQKEKYVAEHFAKQAYPETVVEDADKLNPSEFNQELVKILIILLNLHRF